MSNATKRRNSRMKGLIRANRRTVWHIPERYGDPHVIHAYCGWSFIRPERIMRPHGNERVCSYCEQRRQL